jgi:energy-coupling factor transporter transmembrane protein EcfT
MRKLSNKRNYSKVARIMLLHFSIMLFIAGVVLFLAGFHNVDTATNMLRIQIYTNREFIDTGFTGREFTADEGYLHGMSFIMAGLFNFLISFCMLLSIALWKVEEPDKFCEYYSPERCKMKHPKTKSKGDDLK